MTRGIPRPLALLLAATLACSGSADRRAARSAADTARSASAAVAPRPAAADSVDAAALARMRARIGPAPAHLDGFRSRDSLVLAFARAVETPDTAALRRLPLTVEEFAWLYYPDAPLAKPPYDLDPETMWLQISSRSARGYVRLLDRYAGHLGYQSYRCEARPMVSGRVRLWNACVVTHRWQGESITEPLFGSILERDGWYKFVGLSNRL